MENFFERKGVFKYIYEIRTLVRYHLFFKKKFSIIHGKPSILGIWNIEIYGPNISIGKNVIFIAPRGLITRMTTIKYDGYEGSIIVGNNVLLMEGIRLSSASGITIGDDCMLSHCCYITDADWHDIHDRTKLGQTKPIVLEKGVWVGDYAIVCKGVSVGSNSIIAARAVVTKDVPPNVIVAGNPAKIVKKLDPDRIVTMGALYEIQGGSAL